MAFIPEEEDRIYAFSPQQVMRKTGNENTRFELKPTDDPDRYLMVITETAPRFFMKTAVMKDAG